MTEDLNAALEACEKEEHEVNPIKRLLADDEVQQITGLSYWTLKRYRDKKTLPCLKIGRRTLYEQEGVNNFISKFKKGRND
jgi:predicted DNA-binding transcriptional regulator AlpA